MANTDFFSDQKEQSKVKTAILTKYFDAWSKIISPRSRSGKIAYVDLFSGPGKYENGNLSTPLLILEKCINNTSLRKKVVTMFNDANPKFAKELKKNIEILPGVESLSYKPLVMNTVVSEELEQLFAKKNLIPTLAFIDPWGYKGLTTNLIQALIKDFGSDCIFFFNYNRINMGINNPIVKEHMGAIFGQERAEQMRAEINSLSNEEKELYIVNELAESLSDKKNNIVLPFRFLDEHKHKTSHYLMFVTKHPLGYSVMKDIMAGESSLSDDGVASFSYIPVKHIVKHQNVQLSLLSQYERPLDALGKELVNRFKGQTLKMLEVFDRHHIGTPFTKSNFKEALIRLEADGYIMADTPPHKRIRKGKVTMGDKVNITFLKQNECS